MPALLLSSHLKILAVRLHSQEKSVIEEQETQQPPKGADLQQPRLQKGSKRKTAGEAWFASEIAAQGESGISENSVTCLRKSRQPVAFSS